MRTREIIILAEIVKRDYQIQKLIKKFGEFEIDLRDGIWETGWTKRTIKAANCLDLWQKLLRIAQFSAEKHEFTRTY